MDQSSNPPLHLCQVNRLTIFVNRTYTLIHSIALSFLLYYRASFFSSFHDTKTPILPWLLVFAAELLLSFEWLLTQAFRWRPVSRTVFPERLPEDDKLPAVDVFICTADPEKEPPVLVMNTVISAMALDYPPEKLHVYLSDDGGADVTLNGMREAWRFAKWWIPFCKRYKIKCRSPKAYFSAAKDEGEDGNYGGSDFIQERQTVKEKYEVFEEIIREYTRHGDTGSSKRRDHSAVIEVIQENSSDDAFEVTEAKNMPLLVYVSREKRPSHGHHFKAGALNVLAGFLYASVAEDFFTGFAGLHCKGWNSVYCDPPRPQFLGSCTTNLNDLLVLATRSSSGGLDVAISKYCPLIYGPPKMSFLESMCYAYLAIFPICDFFSLWCFATIPQLCLLNGITLYPQVSNSYFLIFSFVFLSSVLRHLYEVLMTRASLQEWINEQRIWMMRAITSCFYGSLDAFMKKIGMREASFFLTNKVDDNEQLKRYNMGVFDFQTSTLFLAPLASLVILNMASFCVGIVRVIFLGELEKMFIQVFISFYVVVMNYPIIEGMLIRKDSGRIPTSITLLSSLSSIIFYILGSIIFM